MVSDVHQTHPLIVGPAIIPGIKASHVAGAVEQERLGQGRARRSQAPRNEILPDQRGTTRNGRSCLAGSGAGRVEKLAGRVVDVANTTGDTRPIITVDGCSVGLGARFLRYATGDMSAGRHDVGLVAPVVGGSATGEIDHVKAIVRS